MGMCVLHSYSQGIVVPSHYLPVSSPDFYFFSCMSHGM